MSKIVFAAVAATATAICTFLVLSVMLQLRGRLARGAVLGAWLSSRHLSLWFGWRQSCWLFDLAAFGRSLPPLLFSFGLRQFYLGS